MEPNKFSEIALIRQRRDEKKTSSVDGEPLVNTSNIGTEHAQHFVHKDTKEQIVSTFCEEGDQDPPIPGKDEGSR